VTSIKCANGDVVSSGLASSLGFELILPAVRPDLACVAANLIRALAEYFGSEARPLLPGQKIDWASSLLIARLYSPQILALDELAFDGESVVVGVNNALETWEHQSSLCRSNDVDFEPCRYASTIAISPGVLESSGPLEGIRYTMQGAASGWWLFTSDYDGRIDGFKSMKATHAFHILRDRPNVARYLGLPVGYAFDGTSGVVWRDTEAVPGEIDPGGPK
jgi:hypothetical protein